jgi:hypothetical protein
MIFCSYRSQFDSSLEYLIFNLAKKLVKFPKVQSIVIEIGNKLFGGLRFRAIKDYQLLLSGKDLNDIKNLGSTFCSQRSDLRYDLFDIYRIDYIEEAHTSSENYSFPNECTYVLKKSGFFSTIFTAINISFFCDSHNIKLHLDWRNWPYDFDPSIFFNDSEVIYEKRFFGQDILFKASREYLDGLRADSSHYSDYLNFRKSTLFKIFNWCQQNMDLTVIDHYSGKTACFIRRGDKLLREAYPIDIDSYLLNLKKYQNVVVLGDDFYFDEELSQKGGFDHFYLDGHKLKGGDLSHVNKDAVRSILTNFYLLCMSENIIGDPYCNLFAAAMMYRGEHYSKDRNLHPWRLRKYI